ncbi:MAG: tetratricopeptide repeat protein [Leptolyngbyaceae cyanobacterium SM1_4_3]|nr:tetratricopeptide repeat protein [Leptolyngbyaceae cyanobacterium SM1_4_3]
MSQIPQTNPATTLGGRYKVISQLGAGGFGQTFLAQDLHLPGHPRCVVKRLLPQTNDDKSLQMARRLFDTEARALYQLGSHHQIPALFAHFEENQEFYLAQEFVEGESLNCQLRKGKTWPEDQVIALLRDILQVLAFVHQQQVIHRDIKPSNLMRRRKDGRIVLIDFGAVKQVSTQSANPDTGVTDLTVSIGTQGYIPNEQLAGKPRFSSDVYAVGIIGIQALTGIHPKRLGEHPDTGEIDWRDRTSDVSSELAEILECMVRYDFRDRYPTAVEALEAFETLPAGAAEFLPPLPEFIDPPLDSLSGAETTASEIISASTGAFTPSDTTVQISISALESEIASYQFRSDELNGSHPAEPDSAPDQPQASAKLELQPVRKRRLAKLGFGLGLVGLVTAVTTFVALQTGAFLQPVSSPVETVGSEAGNPAVPVIRSIAAPALPAPEEWAAKLQNRGDRLRQNGQFQQALEAYNGLLALSPASAEAHWGRCHSLTYLQQPAEAVVACDDALAINPNYAEAYWSRGRAYREQGRSLQSLRLFERATQLKPDLIGAWVDLGITLQSFGRSVEAISALDRAIALDRNSVEAWATRGEALWNLGRFDQAIASLDKALQIQPDHPQAAPLRQQARERLGY